jgi:L-aspartate oxidase
VAAFPEIEVIEHALVLDLLLTEDGAAAGVTLHVIGEGQRDGVGAVHSRAVVLASGGMGQVFDATTNPPVSTGDGMAIALRAGAALRDVEFVQFHPTVLWLGPQARGQQPLVSEAVRGEGAFLVDHDGVRFMRGQHELADLAPRDVVSKAITRRMHETGRDHVWLDARTFGEAKWKDRFPTILASCREHGIDPVTDLIPVAPACHYASGGVATDLDGRTAVPRLYACGEVACSGVHGANRLASNSLLEGLVFGRRIAADLARSMPPRQDPAPERRTPGLFDAVNGSGLQQVMTRDAGVIRNRERLEAATAFLDSTLRGPSATAAGSPTRSPGTEAWEATNLASVAAALLAAASAREETRGSHWRDDFPQPGQAWLGHLDTTMDDRGQLTTTFRDLGVDT